MSVDVEGAGFVLVLPDDFAGAQVGQLELAEVVSGFAVVHGAEFAVKGVLGGELGVWAKSSDATNTTRRTAREILCIASSKSL